MALHPHEEEDPYGANSGENSTVKTNPVKRIRWATHRATPIQGRKKRQSIMQRFHKRSPSDKSGTSEATDSDESRPEAPSPEPTEADSRRIIYFNTSLPTEAKDEDGHPKQRYPRNKIRTAKYTPLSFVFKNLWFQFHNIANIYFLFIILLSIGSIFGGENPGLNAVPLIVILVITGIKDAIEDARRTILDNELNNAPVQRLVDWDNVNSADEKVSMWRKFKKANSRAILIVWRWWKRRLAKKNKENPVKVYAERATGERASADMRRISTYTERMSYAPAQEESVEMTPVPSPYRNMDRSNSAMSRPPSYSVYDKDKETNVDPIPPAKRDYGNIVNYSKQLPKKGRFAPDSWKNVKVGDFVRLYNNDEIPADVVVLSTSDTDGACYVETKNLDGETNLKVRQALHCSRKIRNSKDCQRAEFRIESEPPHANLYAYSGAARWTQHSPKDPETPGNDMAEPISINNLLLRGCSLRNTEWILGVVVYTGPETKIMLNSGTTPAKRAKIARDLNWNVIYNFIILFCMCLVAAFVEGTFWARDDTSVTFFEYGGYGSSPAMNGFINFWAGIILWQNMIPISLYISLEIVRVFQAFFIYSDAFMYYEPVDYPCTPKSWNISDDLGQIEFIFSDKTGTLTQNVMEFKKATIGGVPYGEAYTEAQAGMQKRQGIDTEAEGAKALEQIARDRVQMLSDLRAIHDNPYLRDDSLTFVAPDFVSDLRGDSGAAQANSNTQFMLALALCHTVITEMTPGNPPNLEFKAQSPDEAALVSTARDCGFTVIGRSDDAIILNVMGEEKEYTVLNTLEFNSSRKRMSAIVRMPDGKIMLFCKGADSIIYSRLKAGEQSDLRNSTAEHLEMFAREGLRTLCVAQKEIPEETYQEWNKEHDVAAAAVENRDDKLEVVSDAIERELTLLGGTAIEDRLQDGVPDSIALLGNAGIKLWVLTGDKVETAVNIGFSCNLLNNDMDLIVLKIDDERMETAEAEIDKNLKIFDMDGSDQELKTAKKDHSIPKSSHAIVIDGDALKLVLDDRLRQKFLLLCKQCKSVLCCRVSPSQKAAVVRMVKKGLDVITLSIGDGANDVAMIQEADVGVGIAGVEGRQAAMSSDFAIGQFRYLARLTLVHGRWNYRRMGETIANFFYKTVVWTFALFWYQIYNSFDCVYIYDYTYILLVNLAFTSLAVIFMGILDQDVSDKVSLAVPQLYKRGIEQREWTQLKFWLYMLDGLYQSIICYYMAHFLFSPATFNSKSGLQINDGPRMGVYVATAAIVAINLYILMNMYRWDFAMIFVCILSVLFIVGWTGIYSSFTAAFMFYESANQVFRQPSFWAQTVLTVIICVLPRFVIKSYQKMYRPRDIDIVREQVRQGKFSHLDGLDPNSPAVVSEAVKAKSSTASEDSDPKLSNKMNGIGSQGPGRQMSEDERPIYPPSTAATNTTRNPHSTQNSDDSTPMPVSATRKSFDCPRISLDRPRPSFDRMRSSIDQLRPSFEALHDMTSASQLSRIESSQSGSNRLTPAHSREPSRLRGECQR